MQKQITSRHFTELIAFRNRNTLSPDLWFAVATAAANIIAGLGGPSIDPRMMVPGQVDMEAWNERRQQSAERELERQASEGM